MDTSHRAEFGKRQTGVESKPPDLIADMEAESTQPALALKPDVRLGDGHAFSERRGACLRLICSRTENPTEATVRHDFEAAQSRRSLSP